MTVPQEAITATAEAIERKLLTDSPGDCMTWLEADEELARAALEAAYPYIATEAAAAERECCAQLAEREALMADAGLNGAQAAALRRLAHLLREGPS